MNSDFDTYISVKDWYESMKTHPCRKRTMVSNDDPKNKMIVGDCLVCGRSFKIELLLVQDTARECDLRIVKLIVTPDGRRELVSSLSDK